MPLPLIRWLSRPLARFLRCTWMSRFLIGPAGVGGTTWFGEGKKARPKTDTRLSLEHLETRFVPQDMLGVLHTGMSIAGAPVLMGTIPSPGQVFLDGWVDHNKPAVLPADLSTSVDTAAQPALPEPAPGQLEALDALATNASHDSGGGACLPEVQPATAIEPVAQTQQGDFSLKPWLDDVGEFLNSPPAHESMSAGTDAAATSGGGGGGGGGSGAPGSGVNSGQPAAPLASAASAPDARSAAQMTQPVAAPALMTSSGAAAAANPAAIGNGGGSQGAHAATPDDQGGSSGSQGGSSQSSSSQPALASSFGQVPLPFEMNEGQASNSAVLAQSNGPGFGFWLTNESMVFAVPHLDAQSGQPDGSDVFTLAMANVNSGAQVAPADLLSSTSNYFTSADSSGWHTDVPQYGQINDNNVWQGVNLELHAASAGSRIFEYDFTVQPGADVSSIQFDPQGLQGVQLDDQGRLLLGTSGGNVVMDAPVIYQTIGGVKTDVSGGYVINADGSIGFQVTGQYDSSQPLVIDPVLAYGSLLGGAGPDFDYGIAADADGSTYLVGQTFSSSFPIVNGYQSSSGGTFIAKLNAQGSGLIYSTFLGDGSTKADAIAVDLAGNAYVVGTADSTFPTTPGAYDTTYSGTSQAGFITKLNGTGDALSYSSYFGADAISVNGVAVDAQGQAHIAGTASAWLGGSTTLPTTAGVVQTTFGGMRDAFAAEFNTAGSSLLYSTYLGGANQDFGNGIALDSSDNAYVVGTAGAGYPTTVGAYQTSLGGLSTSNVFVTKLNSTATSRLYSTYIGSNTNTGTAIAVDRSGQAYVTGAVGSHVLIDALNAAGSTLVYATTLSGNGTDSPGGIAVTGSGNASVVGSTTSTNLSTTTGALQSSLQGTQSAFVLQLTPSATVSYLSYLGGSTTGGGSAVTSGVGVALGPTGSAYVSGTTNTTNFPTSSGAYSTSNAGGYDAFAAEFLPGLAAPVITAISSDTGSSSTDHITSTQNLSISGTATPSTTVTLERADLGLLGTASVSAGGTWTYNYTGTTLTDNTYDFIARDVNGSGAKSGYSNDFLVTVDDTAPAVTLSVPATTTTLAPKVSVVAKDLVGMPATTTVTLDLSSTSSSGPWTSGYASATMTGGEAQLTLPALSGTGTYWLRARANDLAGNQGTSAVSSFTVNSATSWSGSATALSADPEEGDLQMQMGAVQFSHSLDLDRSPGIDQGGDPALVYNSGEVSQKPIIQLQLSSPNNASLPSTISAQLTFNATAAFTVTYNTTGFNEGDTLTMALQASTAITTTGGYSWSVSVTAGAFSHTYTGYTFVVAQDSSPLGAGWSFAGVNQLVSISASGSVPAGMLMVFGTGGYRFYQGTSSFTSPTGDNGTLTLSGGTYTYSTPDGESWTYNSSGLMTQWTSPDGNETLQYRYDGSNRLDGITAIDGAVSTFTYTGSTSVAIQTVNSRTTTLTLSGGNLAEITNADGGVQTLSYDANHRLTEEDLGITENDWGYTSAGVLATMTQGGTMGIGSSPSNTVFDPALTQGLSTLLAGAVQAISTNADGASFIEQLDNQGRPLSETAGDGGTTTLTYSNGFLTSETDPLGRTTTYSLDSADYVTKVTMPDNSVITYQYQSAFHALTTMTDERNETTTYAYDSGGHLTSTTDPLSDTTTFTWTAGGLLQTETDANNHTTTYSYDSDRRLTAETDPTGATTSISYDANGNVHTITDALSHVTTINYDVMDRLTGTTNALSGTTAATYDISGLELTSTDENGVKTQYVYDPYDRGLLVEIIVGANTGVPVTEVTTYDADEKVIGQRDSIGGTTQYAYDFAGNVTGVTDAAGNTTHFDYDLAGQNTASRDPMGNWTQDSYNSRGWVTQETDPLGNVTGFSYDADGNLTSITDPLSHTTTYSYDAANELTTIEDPLTHVVTLAYDPVGNVTATTDGNGITTSYTYDADNELTTETDAVSTGVQRTNSMGYDAIGNVTTVTDGNSQVTTLAYDALYRATSVTDPLSHVTTISYDSASDVTSVKDALGHTATITNDAIERAVASTDPLTHTGTVVLDGNGDTAATIDPLGNVSVAIIDPLGRTVGSIDALGNVTLTTLDRDGNVRLVTDPTGNETHYVYDRDGDVTQTITPIGTTTDSYDAGNRLTQETDADGRVVQFSYDNDDRLTGEVWKNASLVTVNTLTFTWDNDDNLLTAANSTGTATYTYDALDRVQTYTNVWGQVLTYSYDNDDNVTQRTDSLGGTLTYVYDNADRLTSEEFSGTGATGTVIRVDFGYDAANRQTTITWYSNLAGTSMVADSAYSYDNADRLTSIVNTNGAGATLSYYDYSYDNDNRVSTQTHWSQVGTTVYSGTNTYTYDAISQLTSDGSSYSYDANGNRTMAGYTTGPDNEMTNDGVYTYGYDAEGNMTSKTSGTGSGQITWTYSYDNANEMTGVVETGSTGTLTQITYSYDAEGQRVGEQVWTGSTVTTRYAIDPVDGENTWADLDGSNNMLVRYEWGSSADQILTRTVASGGNAGAWAYLTDEQGSVRDLVNWSGSVQDHLDYNGYGVVTESNPSVGSRYEFDGYQYEATTGLDFTEARWYNPSTGTWQTQDPAGFAAGQANLNQYVGNDPTNETDPTGLGAGGGWSADSGDNLPSGLGGGNDDGLHRARMTLHGEWGTTSDYDGLGHWGSSGGVGTQTGGSGVWGPGGLDLGSLVGGQPIMASNFGAWGYVKAFGEGLAEGAHNLAIGAGNAAVEAGQMARDVGNTVVSAGSMVGNAAGLNDVYTYDLHSKTFSGYDTAVKEGRGDAYTLNAMADGASLGVKPLVEAGYQYYKTGDAAQFSQSCGGVAAGNLMAAAGGKVSSVVGGKILSRIRPKGGSPKVTKPSCFPAGTPVQTSAGLKPIEQIEEGDRVWAFDHQRLVWAEREVVEAYELLHRGTMATIQVRGATIRATGGHSFWVLRGEALAQRPLPKRIAATEAGGRLTGRWVLARDLRAGDEVLLRHGEVVPLESVHLDEVVQQVYNFTVAELQNYAVGAWGVLVHNANDPQRTIDGKGDVTQPNLAKGVPEPIEPIIDAGLPPYEISPQLLAEGWSWVYHPVRGWMLKPPPGFEVNP